LGRLLVPRERDSLVYEEHGFFERKEFSEYGNRALLEFVGFDCSHGVEIAMTDFAALRIGLLVVGLVELPLLLVAALL